ncbi:hypothetical protein K501DRAFT_207617 [Backusella circina FSU 941]|nr:hypothetical protein K501DRAFT_207617 [Backusella circina FSU 941]
METKPRRPNYQPYVPVHRRRQAEEEVKVEQSVNRVPPQSSTTEVKRRGRGQFRAPPPSSSVNYEEEEKEPIKQVETVQTVDLAREFELKLQLDAKKIENEDWESLLDDDEEEELLITKPETPTRNSNNVKPVVEVDEKALEELSTVLDCYDFPNTFKSQHLQGVFREYEKMRGGFQIKWMDDTRALVIFGHPATAKKAYIDLLNSSIVKVRPYKGQLEIKPTGPVPRRPVTTDMVAKRLVHGALGVRTVKTPEQRAAEKELLQAAREQRELDRLNNQKRQKEIASAFDE